MKRLSSFFMAICLIILSCEKETIEGLKKFGFNEPVAAKSSERLLINNNSSQVILEVQTIIDRRCPDHENCNDSGEGIVKIRLSNGSNSSSETMLALGNYGDEAVDTVFVKLDKRRYSVVLTGISPKPSDTQHEGESKTAEFLVSELD